MQRNRVFVSEPATTDVPIVMQKNDWLFKKGKNGQRLGDKALTDKVRSDLVEATELYASSLSQVNSVKSLTETLKRIEAWEQQTKVLRNYVWIKNNVSKADFMKWEATIGRKNVEQDDIYRIHAEVQARIFCRPQHEVEQKFALAQLDRVLLGSLLTAQVTKRELKEGVRASDVRNLWFMWAALVFSILREAGVRLKHPNRENLLGGPVALLAQLQSKLPEQLHLRKVPKGERPESVASFRKAAVVAFKIRRSSQPSTIRDVLTRWVGGDFRAPTKMSEAIIATRLKRLASKDV